MPASDGDKPATQADLEAVKSELKADIQRLDFKIESVGSTLDGKIEAVRSALDGKIESFRSELKEDMKRLGTEIVQTNSRISRLEDSMDKKMTAHADRIMTALDGLAKLATDDNRRVVLHAHILTEHTDKLADHDQRVARIESKP